MQALLKHFLECKFAYWFNLGPVFIIDHLFYIDH